MSLAPLGPPYLRSARSSNLKPLCASVEIGIGLTGFGFVLTFLGVLFFFDKGLLAMGNVCRHLHLPTACFQLAAPLRPIASSCTLTYDLVHADPVRGRRGDDNRCTGNVQILLETKKPEGEHRILSSPYANSV